VDEVRKKFNETQLGEMVADPVMQPFIDDFKSRSVRRWSGPGRSSV